MSDLGEMIKFLCERENIALSYFRKQISKPNTKYHIRSSKLDEILDSRMGQTAGAGKENGTSSDKAPTIKRLSLFWRSEYNIHIPENYFYFSVRRFKDELTKSHKIVDRLVSTYQVLRPFQDDPALYAAEALQIVTGARGIQNFMYSHNFSKIGELYIGDGKVAKRYYFSLLSRPHEDGTADSAFRAIIFYVGEELAGYTSEFLSGLMLRGVSGIYASSKDYAVAVPFLAIPLGTDVSLDAVEPQDLFTDDEDDDKLRRMHKDGYLIVGKIKSEISKNMFQFCDKIFSSELFKSAQFEGNPLVLRTIVRNRLRPLGITATAWKECVRKALVEFSSKK